MKHIDRDRLYTDIEYRFEYMCSFLDFGASDKALIVAAAPLLADQIPTIVDNVYGKLLKYDILAASFMHRMQNYDGEVIRDLSQLNVNSEQIKFRRSMLKRYLVCAMLGVNDMATLLQYLEWVSLIHTRNTSKHSSINVEYIHLGAMLSYIDLSIHAALTRLELPADTLTRTQAAFTKMFALQNDLFALYYTHGIYF
ncbi:Protoglobin-domain-containing protein [Blastocladiella britannica]|nr:Protoglobin-domain-containing protein [Blastocladiella britannica]